MAGINSDTVNLFKTLIPDLSGETDDTIETFLKAAVDQRMNVSAWAEAGKFHQGAIYLAAHLLTLTKRTQVQASGSQGVGAVTDLSEGDLSVSYEGAGKAADEDPDLAQTSYGLRFKAMRDSLPSTPVI